MDSSLTPADIAALAGIMVLGAAVPSLSVLAVSARSAAYGFAHGVFTSIGIVVGDIVFILIAVYGLSVLAGLMGSYFGLIKYLGGAYLVWLGIVLWRSQPKAESAGGGGSVSIASSVMAGLLITLADQKAILFYFGFFPAFINLPVSPVDAGLIVAVAAAAVGGPKLVYAFMADRGGRFLENGRAAKAINIVAGSVMIGVGVFLVARAVLKL